MTGKSPHAIVLVACVVCKDLSVIGAEEAQFAFCLGSGGPPHPHQKLRVASPDISVGSYWYEDDRRLEGAPWRDNRGRTERWPRETGRILRVVGWNPAELMVELQQVGGRWISSKDLGKKRFVKMTRFGKSGGYKSLPDEHLGDVVFIEGFPIDIK